MILPNKLYDILKYVAQIGLPALATLWASLGSIWDWENTEQTVNTIVAVNVALGALLAISRVSWGRSEERYDGVALIQETPPDQDDVITDLLFKKTPEEVAGKGELTLTVQKIPMYP